jgi:hypothetical protein
MYSYVLFCVFYLHSAVLFYSPETSVYFHSPRLFSWRSSGVGFWSALLHFLPSTIRLLLYEDRPLEPKIPRCSRRFFFVSSVYMSAKECT